MSSEPRDYLQHILDEIEYLIEHSEGLSYSQFESDQTLRRAFVRSLEIIGEAAKKIPEAYRAENPDIEWRRMTGLRDHLIHKYFGVDYEIVWDVLQSKVPQLRDQIRKLLGM